MGFEETREADKTILSIFHEIRTPLTVIHGLTQKAQQEIESRENVNQYLARIERATDYLLRLTKDALDYGKNNSSGPFSNQEPFLLIEILNSVLDLTRPLWEMKSQEVKVFTLNLPSELVVGDATKIQQILINILSNAVKYTPEHGTIQLEAGVQSQTDERILVFFTVQDNGIGMSTSFMKNMFDPYTREREEDQAKAESSGLGLYITKRLVDHIGGTLSFKSKEGEGTRAEIILPVTKQRNLSQPNQTSQIPPKRDSGSCSFDGKRILLVEDNEDISEILTDLLQPLNLEVQTSADGLDAVRRFLSSEAGYFNAILMDLTLPLLDGMQATSEIRSSIHPDAKNIPIIAMTAHHFDSNGEAALESGMNGYLTKPFQMHKLCQLFETLWEDGS